MNVAPLYRLREITKRHHNSFLLHVGQLDIDQGEVLCLLGPTGAGKSTLLRILADLEPPDSGEVSFHGQSFVNHRLPLDVRRQMTMVFQRPLVLSGTVRTNVAYGLRLRGSRQESSRMVDRALECFGLSRLASQPAHTLSGGQMRLVALARALVVQPDVLLLDEPTADLDPAHVAMVEGVLQVVQRERGTTLIWATHNLFQARRVAGRVGFLLNGQLIEVASTKDFFDHPCDSRAADFVQGKMIC